MKTLMDADTVGLIERTMLSYGLFRRYPHQRFTAAEEFASHGYTVEDLNRLASAVHNQKPRNVSAALAAWLKDKDGGLHDRVLSLRAEVRSMSFDRAKELQAMSQEDRRERAMRGIAGLVSDDWPVSEAAKQMSQEFELADAITEDEALGSGVVKFRKRISPEGEQAFKAMLERIADRKTK